jgi:hypothetical protein
MVLADLVALVVQPEPQAMQAILVLLVMLLVTALPALAVPPAAVVPAGALAAEVGAPPLGSPACQAAVLLPLGLVARVPSLVGPVAQEVVHQGKAEAVAVVAVSLSA